MIKAFNDDLPYDQFVKAQLAADLMDDTATRARIAAGARVPRPRAWFYDNGAVEITRADERHDRVDAVTRGFLGLTVGCARCHDHKYDPDSDEGLLRPGGRLRSIPSYHEYPLVPKSVVDEYKTAGKADREEAEAAR